MNRRKLLLSIFGLTGVVLFDLRTTYAECEDKYLRSGDSHIVLPGEILKLPKHPGDQDFVHIVVEGKSLKNPASICSNHKIIGESDPLILDSMAIIKLVFHKTSGNWILG